MSSEAANRDLVDAVRPALRELADAEKAPKMRAYLKSEMPLLGVQTPGHRAACEKLFRRFPIESAPIWRGTALALWREAQFREERYCALNLLNHPPYARFRDLDALPMYREMIVTGAWWDLVDNIAPISLGALLEEFPGEMSSTMRRWARGKDIWKRRAAIICQLKRKERTDLELLYDCIEPSLGESEFFLRKAIGWVLREYGKTDPEEVVAYVRRESSRLSALSRREALRNILSLEELRAFEAAPGVDGSAE